MASVAASQLNENDYLILDQLEKLYMASPLLFPLNNDNIINTIISTLENDIKGGGLSSLVSQNEIHENEIRQVFKQFVFKESTSRYQPGGWQNSPGFNDFNRIYGMANMQTHYQKFLRSYPNLFDSNTGIYSKLYNIPEVRSLISPEFGMRSQPEFGMRSGVLPPSPYQSPDGFGLRPPPFGAQYAYGGKKRSKSKKSKYLKKKSTKKRYKYTKNKYDKKNKSKKLKRRR